jgi:hypothetical protein
MHTRIGVRVLEKGIVRIEEAPLTLLELGMALLDPGLL